MNLGEPSELKVQMDKCLMWIVDCGMIGGKNVVGENFLNAKRVIEDFNKT